MSWGRYVAGEYGEGCQRSESQEEGEDRGLKVSTRMPLIRPTVSQTCCSSDEKLSCLTSPDAQS